MPKFPHGAQATWSSTTGTPRSLAARRLRNETDGGEFKGLPWLQKARV